MSTPDDNPFAPPSQVPPPAPGYAQPPPVPSYPQQPAAAPGYSAAAAPPPTAQPSATVTPPAPALPRTNGSATASFILSLFGIVPLVSIVAIILGRFALSTVRRTGEGGYGLAKAGTVIGYVGAAGWLLVVVFIVASIAGALASA